MEKWEDKIKKEVNKLPPKIITTHIEDTLQRLPRNRRLSKLSLSVAAILVAFTTSLGMSYISPTAADTFRSIPIVGSVFETVGNIGLKKGSEQGLTIELGQQIEFDRHRVTFTESLYDGSEIHIGYIIESLDPTNPKPNQNLLRDIRFGIDGQYIDGGWGARGLELDNGNYAETLSLRPIDEIPDNFILEISPWEGRSWKVNIPVERQGDSDSFLVNITKETKDIILHYDMITFFPTATEIAFRTVEDTSRIENIDNSQFIQYLVVDDQGRVLQPFGGGGGGIQRGDKVIQSLKYTFEPLDTIPNSLTVKPYLESREEAIQVQKKKWSGEVISLSQGGIGDMTVLSVEENDGVTTISYIIDGEDAYSQSSSFRLEDSNGNHYYTDDMPPARVEGTINQYKATFLKAPPLDDLFIAVFQNDIPNFIEELEIKIDLQK
ncbi:DUF4179 domain-containing protein [Evansella sp. AB-rgal1]|uniref:DUF4179 domain-containing protein n=1 Tax=Evansella sp. AB-rgal1 TaxID=3242696 RepID=UPI00359D5B40